MNLSTIYTICAVAGGTLLVLRVILMAAGVHDGSMPAESDLSLDHGDLSGSHDGPGGALNFLSLQSIAGFFTMFGLVGLGLLRVNASDIASLLGGLAAGVVTAWVTGMIFLGMRRLQSEGTLDLRNAVGQVGTVYLTIPAKGTGVVNVTVQGGLRAQDAVSENGQPIATGAIVKVVGITAGNILVVTEQAADTH